MRTSGPLQYREAKGLHRSWATWWIDLPLKSHAFRITDPEGRTLAALDEAGRLTVAPGYLWDGSSGPTVDGAADPVPSLVHDVLYEAMRARKLSKDARSRSDGLYYDLLRERGMSRTRAGLRWIGLRIFAGWAASPRKGAEYPLRVAQ